MRPIDIKNNLTEKESDVLLETKKSVEDIKKIIIYNDDYHSFDFVIDTLIEVCKHESEQAEQCTYIIHHSGKCEVKRDSYKKLEPICSELLRRGLTAEITK